MRANLQRAAIASQGFPILTACLASPVNDAREWRNPQRRPDDEKRGTGGPLTQAMRRKLRRAGCRGRYRLRKQIVDPVFGQIKQASQFLLRGLEKVRAEWAIICTAPNLTKLAKAA